MKLISIGDDPTRPIARIADLDTLGRRVFNLDRLIDAVRDGVLGLAAPHGWDDPREDLAALCVLDGFGLSPPKGQQSLADFLAPAWAQCWSMNLRSDTLLRAYSRVDRDPTTQKNRDRAFEGATVTTTSDIFSPLRKCGMPTVPTVMSSSGASSICRTSKSASGSSTAATAPRGRSSFAPSRGGPTH